MQTGATQPMMDPDAPICPACGYLLIGLAAPSTCPECGAALEADLSRYRPSLQSTPWSAGRQPRAYFKALAQSLLHPITSAQRCRDPSAVSAGGAFTFALITTLATVLLWPVLKEGGLFIAGVIGGNPTNSISAWFRFQAGELGHWFRWKTYCGWEAWSIMRWWLLFAVLAAALQRRATADIDRPHRLWLRRLMLFAPWIVLLELGHLIGVWLVEPNVVPEPNTMFASWPAPILTMMTSQLWLTRAVVPTFVAGLIFARGTLSWRWRDSILLALALVPTGILLSIAWSLLFIYGGLLELLYRR
jgi:hypothetical protein